ncbi:hypothetical protein LTR94_038092, partial [Friedmanniomyces endolithicus]
AVDVDQGGRGLDLELHEVEQVGAAGDEAGVRGTGDELGGLSRRSGALVGECLHALTPPTSVIASMMFE